MAQQDGAIYIVALCGGLCVEKMPEGLKDNDCKGNKTQQWTVEYGGNENEIAFQNVGNGEWLFMTKGAQWAKCDTSTKKQWWTLQKGEAPGSCWIECNDYPGYYLCNLRANITTNNVVHAWNKEMHWMKTMLWYIKDANAPGFSPKEWKSASAGQDETTKQREDALIKKEQDIAAKEAEQNKFAEQLAAKEKELDNLQQSVTKPDRNESSGENLADLQRQLDDLKAKERDIAAIEAAAAQSEKQALKKEAEMKKSAAKLKAENGRLLEELSKLSSQNKPAESKPCNHKLYPPPKKIERRVVGFLYE